MGVEESVYLAKLAEQAERYEGKSSSDASFDRDANPEQKWWRT